MDRFDFYFDQLVTEGEIDAAFDAAEQADWDLAADHGLVGVVSGLAVSQNSPTPDLTVDVTAGIAYDADGKRIFVGASQDLDLSVDHLGVSTAVAAPGNSKVISIFAYADRLLSDNRIDGNSNPVSFSRAEAFAFKVVQGAEATTGAETPPALEADKILIADVTIDNAQTQILDADVNSNASGGNRRGDAFVASAGSLAVREGTSEAAVQALLTELNNHVTDVANAHATSAIDGAAYTGANGIAITATDLASQLEEIADTTTLNLANMNATNVDVSGTLNGPGTSLWNTSQLNTGDVPLYVQSGMHLTAPISPTSSSAAENNYNPTGWLTAGVMRLTPNSGGTTLNGLQAPGGGGEYRMICNISTADNVVLAHKNAGSTATNRFVCPGGASYTIEPGGAVMVWYDPTSGRWRVVDGA